jgi:DNA-binding NtrC family response regulator
MHEELAMIALSAVLVARNSAVVESVQRTTDSLTHVHLHTCGSLAEARPFLNRSDVFLLLIHLPGDNGFHDVVAFLRDSAPSGKRCASIVLSDGQPKANHEDLLQAGAMDCLSHPFDWRRLSSHVENLAGRSRAETRGDLPAEAGADAPPLKEDASLELLGRDSFYYVLDPDMSQMMEMIRRVAPQDTTLLFTGETGTGKTRLARLVHELSPRRADPFMVLDCGALSPTLIESEMFGHVKGSFTGADRDRPGKLAAAGKGTLLLDEINALPLPLQSKLLRAVDDRVFEPVGSNRTMKLQARLVAISNTLLDHDVTAGLFRADLYYRLNVVSFYLPPLRERRATIVPLAKRFLTGYAARNRPDIHSITTEALQALEDYDWPGNIRELRNIVERAVALSQGPEIQVSDLPELIRPSAVRYRTLPLSEAQPCSLPFTLSQSKEKVEVQRILEALKKHKNNRLRAAAELGISRMGLYKKLRKYGLMNTA